MKKFYNIVFVVLVYRNTQDLLEFFAHLSLSDSKVIVVESFYSNQSTIEFKKIAEENSADFISVPNNGYGAGNNKGCKYALENYNFNFLIISNADIIIKRFNIAVLDKYKNSIVAPKIINMRGKNQNPSSPFKPNKVIDYFALRLYKGNHFRLIWIYYAFSRFKKILFYSTSWFNKRIFSAHGAFVIFPYSVLLQMFPLYNEEMFLFNEEEHLGKLAESKGISTYYEPNIEIIHKEDGSINIASVNVFERIKESFIIYYNYWNK